LKIPRYFAPVLVLFDLSESTFLFFTSDNFE